EAVAPTCTETGRTEGKKCSVCEKILVAQRVVSTIPHNYDKTEVTAPTCTEQGYTTYLCQCGESMVGSYVAATGHKSILALGVNPTCTEPGISNGRKCRVCNEVLSGLTPLAPTGHKYEESTVLPTCTKEGLSTFTCHCGDFYTESIAPTGHTSVTDIALSPTCTETGLTEGAHCSVCSEVLVKQEAVPALGHTFAHGIRCDACPIYKGSEGLCFELNADGKGYTVIGIGECTDTLLIIPESHLGLPVTAVGERAFASCNTITAAIIANNVINIYSQAFEYCDNLMHVTIGESVEKIYSDPFHCDRLVEISNKSTHFTLSNELASYNQVIGIYNAGDDHTSRLFLEDGFVIYDGGEDKTVVNYLGNQSDASLPSYVTKINRHAFSYCDSLASITVPDNVTNIGQYAFYHCAAKIIWGENPKLTTIPEHAFAFYEHINFIVPKGVTSIENRAFYYSDLMAVEIPDTVTTVGERAFFYCGNLQKIKIPDSVTSMGEEAFSTCYGMTDVEIGNGLTVIPQSAFYACVSLKSVFIGTGVSTIEFEAFRGCTPLGRIAIPDNVKVVDKWAFYDCPELEIYCEATFKPSGWSDEWNLSNRPVTWGCTILNGVALIPNEDGISYSAVGTIRPFSGRVDIPASHNQKEVTALCDNAFSTVEIMEVSIPATVKSIGKDLFFGQGPKNIFYEGTLEQWAQIDFKWYMSPFNLYVGEKLVTDVVFDSTLEISDWAFSGCVSIETVKISHGSSVVRLGENSFHRCENLKTVVLGKGVSTISKEAFSHCSSLLSVTLADNLIFIEENAFNNCGFLSSITVLGQSLSVAELAFNGCDKLEKIYYMGTITDWYYFVIIEDNNAPLTGSRVYYYTSSAPGVEGCFWHYGEDGEVVEWPPIEKEAQAA
ncbi:MAG: leucine-rich repeat domain-containing protein, partial [Clostridia bacterium]|nr:leucine-rich repeat domain-containing protein [Clostridia bacterium]